MSDQGEHIVIRNNKLFCERCGREKEIPLPVSVRVLKAYSDDFSEQHRQCKQTWTQPFPDQTQGEIDKAQFWLAQGERGISSETIFSVLAENPLHRILAPERYCHPLDPDDFRRCSLLLKTVPEWRGKMDKMRSVSPQWAALVDNWDKLEAMLAEQMNTRRSNGMYEYMESLGC